MKAEKPPIRSRCSIRKRGRTIGSAAACPSIPVHAHQRGEVERIKIDVRGMRCPYEDCINILASADAHGLERIAYEGPSRYPNEASGTVLDVARTLDTTSDQHVSCAGLDHPNPPQQRRSSCMPRTENQQARLERDPAARCMVS